MERLAAKRLLGRSGVVVPPIFFGTSALGNLYRALPYGEKREIAAEWLNCVEPPVVLDSAGKYGAGLALETLGRLLAELEIPAKEVTISNKLGWKRVPLSGSEPTFEKEVWREIDHDAVQEISYRGMMECWEQGCELLGHPYRPRLASVHDPDEYIFAGENEVERGRRFEQVLEAYRALADLKRAGELQAIGVGAKDWTVIRDLSEQTNLDWVMFACSFTVYRHPRELRELIESLARGGVGVVNSALFNAGFLTGGDYFDYRRVSPASEPELFAWRERFFALCSAHDVAPADACVEFGLSDPGIVAVALNTGNPRHVRTNVDSVLFRAPRAFWQEMKEDGLIDASYPYLG